MTPEINKLSDSRLIVHFKTEEPINFAELSRSFLSVADLCENSVSKSLKKEGKDSNIGLHVSKIENNCFLVELAQIASEINQAYPILNPDTSNPEQLKLIVKCATDLSEVIRKFMKVSEDTDSFELSSKLPKKLATTALNMLGFLEKSEDGALDIKAMDYEKSEDGSEHFIDSFSNKDLKKAKKGVAIVLDLYNKTSEETMEKVPLRFIQANVGKDKGEEKSSFRAIIKNVSDADFPVFMKYEDKKKIKKIMNDAKINPFTVSHTVDVEILMNKDGNPKSYKILKFHDE